MRTLSRGLAAVAVLAMLGCSGSGKGPAAPDPGASSSATDLGPTFLPGGDELPGLTGNSLLGMYDLEVDLGTMTGEATMVRSASQFDEITHLSIDSFLTPNSITLSSVTRSPNTINLGYVFTHPFAGPLNMAAPATAVNRADLAISARMLVIADLPTGGVPADYTFFGGEAIANTDLIANADGYYKPAGLLDPTATTTNTFPYKLVVDEASGTGGNRREISNAGTAIGNYRATDGTGWQAQNIANGGVNNGWHGYDVLFQGQSATGELQLSAAAITADAFTLRVAVVGKYMDPRFGTTKAERQSNRLPANPTVDVRKFLFRMPYGALDASAVKVEPETGGLSAGNTSSTTTVRVHVRDWDALASETTQADLEDETDGTLVLQGTSGVPTVTVDIKTVTSTPVTLTLDPDDSMFTGGDPGADNGPSDDPLYYDALITNAATGTQTNGTTVRGMLRIEDPENALTNASEFHLDPALGLLTSNKPEIVTYQALRVALGGVTNQAPSSTVQIQAGTNPVIASGGSIVFETTTEFDNEGDAILYDVDVTTDATYESTGYDPIPTPTTPIHSGALNVEPNPGGVNLVRSARVRYYDAAHIGTPTLVDLPYEIAPAGANLPPTATVVLLNTQPPANGYLAFQVTAENDPEGNPVTYAIDYDFGGVFTADVTGLNPTAPPLPTTLNVSPAQPGLAAASAHTARVQFTDGFNAPLNIDLPYLLGGTSGGCLAQTLGYDFNAGLGGWTYGNNSDASTFGHFTLNCTSSVATAAMGTKLSGGYFTSGEDDASSCGWLNDYGRVADYNVVSPYINLPATCAPGSVHAFFNLYQYSRATTSEARFQISTDYGTTWTSYWTNIGTNTAQPFQDVAVALPDALAGTTLLARMSFVDPDNSAFYSVPGSANGDGNSAGITFDNIRFTVGATAPITTGFTPPTLPCLPRNRSYNFLTAQGWVGGQNAPTILPNGDRGSTNGGWGSFRWTNCGTLPDSSGVAQAVATASGGLITGDSLNITNDGTSSSCGSFTDDYGYSANYNVVSPRVFVPPTCSGGTVSLSWVAYINLDDTQGGNADPGGGGWDTLAVVKAYISNDNGSTWTQVWNPTPLTQAGQTLPVSIPIPALYEGSPNGLRVRFEFVSTNTFDQDALDNYPFGLWIDNVVLTATNTTSDWIPF